MMLNMVQCTELHTSNYLIKNVSSTDVEKSWANPTVLRIYNNHIVASINNSIFIVHYMSD